MNSESPLSIRSFPRAILHIDGDAFFASCEQARNPALRGRPVVTGKERGIASSMSYEAKALGVTRAMKLHEIKRMIPDVVILPSDYETYSLLSKRFYSIVRRYTSDVEEYGIDECFADITGLRRALHMSYPQIAEKIKEELDRSLGFTFSVGLAPTKVLAKIGSKWKKPSGLTVIPGREAHRYLARLEVGKVWGIGPQTTSYLAKHGIQTALDFARMSEAWIRHHLSKPFYEIWQELNCQSILTLTTKERETRYSIQKFKTFTPPSIDKNFIFAQLSKNIENACIRARKYELAAGSVVLMSRTQNFHHASVELTLSRPSNFPHEIIELAKNAFSKIYKPRISYRGTGVVLASLVDSHVRQLDLFESHLKIERMQKLYQALDSMRAKYGKHTVFLASSFQAQKFSQHEGERGDGALRKKELMKGEGKRRRINIPMLMGEI